MSRTPEPGSRSDIEVPCFPADSLAKLRAEEPNRVQVDLPAEEIRKFRFELEHAKSGPDVGLELDQEIEVAVRSEVIPKGRSEDR